MNQAFVGGLFMSMIVYFAFMLPLCLLRKKIVFLMFHTIAIGLLIAVEWLPVWIGVIMLLMVYTLFSGVLKRM